jgi:ATP-binding cassette subfamily B protein
VEIETLRDVLCATSEALHATAVDKLLDQCAIPAGRRQRARRALLEEQIATRRVGTLWQLRIRPGSSFLRQAWDSGLGRRLLLLCGAHTGEYVLWLLAWYTLGVSALNDRSDPGFLMAWVLILVTIVPFRMIGARSMGALGVGIGGLLKQRLLAGALGLDIEQIWNQGPGQLLGRVMESDSVESLALSGGVAAGMAAFELAMSAVVLWLGAGGAVHMLLLAGWVGATGFLCRRYASRRAEWTASRLQMTNDLVENMAGHRTRMAQLTPGTWHREEDESLDRYLAASAALDREYARLAALVPQGWLTLGLAGLAPAILAGGPVDLRATAVGLGGVLLAHQALQRLAAGLSSLAGAAISWRNVAELFHAAARIEPPGVARVNATSAPRDVVRAQDIHFRFRDRGEPVLRGASLRVSKGDWVLVEGGSGGGKSTLAALLAGSCEPESGLLLARGMDRRTLGAREWRRQVAVAPQYHDNHILTESLAFNLLLGRRWPPNETDWAEAEAVCHELGLGELLERMPAGLQQVVGETGWQLSQGERSRVFMARALLQKSSLVILDESFAALDPENLRQCLECALKRAETLMVVAHP